MTVELVGDEQLAALFDVACELIDNTAGSPFPYDPGEGKHTRRIMLYLMVCHLATMATWELGQTGAVNSAGEGSVSVSFGVQPVMGEEWLGLTSCGRTLFQMLKPYFLGGKIFTVDNFHPWG